MELILQTTVNTTDTWHASTALGDQLGGLLLRLVISFRGRYITFTSLDFLKAIAKVQLQEQKLVFSILAWPKIVPETVEWRDWLNDVGTGVGMIRKREKGEKAQQYQTKQTPSRQILDHRWTTDSIWLFYYILSIGTEKIKLLVCSEVINHFYPKPPPTHWQ